MVLQLSCHDGTSGWSCGLPPGPMHPTGQEYWLRARRSSRAMHGDQGNRSIAFSMHKGPSGWQPKRQARKGMQWRRRLNKFVQTEEKAKWGQGDLSQSLLLPAFLVPPPMTKTKRLSSWICPAVFMRFCHSLLCTFWTRRKFFPTQKLAFNFGCFFYAVFGLQPAPMPPEFPDICTSWVFDIFCIVSLSLAHGLLGTSSGLVVGLAQEGCWLALGQTGLSSCTAWGPLGATVPPSAQTSPQTQTSEALAPTSLPDTSGNHLPPSSNLAFSYTWYCCCPSWWQTSSKFEIKQRYYWWPFNVILEPWKDGLESCDSLGKDIFCYCLFLNRAQTIQSSMLICGTLTIPEWSVWWNDKPKSFCFIVLHDINQF